MLCLYDGDTFSCNLFYSVISAEILRRCKATTIFQYCVTSAKILIGRIRKKKDVINHMKKALKFGKANGYIINILIKVCKL